MSQVLDTAAKLILIFRKTKQGQPCWMIIGRSEGPGRTQEVDSWN